MITNKRIFGIREDSMRYTNIKYGIVGLSVGAVMSLLAAVFSNNGISAREVFINVLYSTAITLSIANVVAQYQCRFNPSNISFWKFILGYYFAI